jgi:oligopeptide transport system permease protein
MMGYALRRILGAIPTLFVIVTLAFFMMRAAPGGPFDSERRLPPEVERNVKAAYDLDKPVVQQYFLYLGKLVHGDLGPSYKNKDFTVAQLIATGLPVSVRLGLCAMSLALLLGTFLGVMAALRQNRWQDYSVMGWRCWASPSRPSSPRRF